MRCQKRLLSALVGLALLAIPVAAAAKDHGRNHRANLRLSHEYHFKAARNFRPSHPAPRFRRSAAPRLHERWAKNERAWNNRTFVPNYGYKTYAPAVVPYNSYPAPYSPPLYAYAPFSNYGNSCAQRIQRLHNQAWIDRRKGHPAAAADLERRMRSLISECGNSAGAPSYYGYGYGTGYGPAYQGGYNQPFYAYNNGGLSTLVPLLQGFVP